MRTSAGPLRWRMLTGLGVAGIVAASLAWSAPPETTGRADTAASASAPTPADALPAEITDLSDKVEVVVNGGLRSTSRTEHSAAVVLKNVSDASLEGPLVVTVDGTGIDALELVRTDGELSDGRTYVEIVAGGAELKAGRSTRPHKLGFKTAEALTPQARGQFSLQLKVYRLNAVAETARAEADDEEKIPGKSYSQKRFDRVCSIQEKWTIPLIQKGNGLVYGTAVAEDADGDLVVEVFVQRSGLRDSLPDSVDGIPVKTTTIGRGFRAGPAFNDVIYEDGRPRKAQRGSENEFQAETSSESQEGEGAQTQGTAQPLPPFVDPTVRFNRPVPIGVSIANVDRLFAPDPEDALCYSGTLGCRCVDALGNQYFLTNLHVGGALLVPDNDSPVAMVAGIGERIVQPSTGDMVNFCTLDVANVIGNVADFEPIFIPDDEDISFLIPHLMDACLVNALPGAVGFNPPENGYTAVKRDIMDRPYIGMPVQKFGRTTVYTSGNVTSLNAAIFVPYGGDVPSFFIRQILVANLSAFGQAFVQGGDSGSLLVAHKPGSDIDGQPVGLVFAAGPSGAVNITVANPIGPILTRFGVQIDDGRGPPYQAGQSGTSGGAIAPSFPRSKFDR